MSGFLLEEQMSTREVGVGAAGSLDKSNKSVYPQKE